MKQEIYKSEKPNVVHAEFDSDLGCIITTWYTLIAPEDTDPCYRALAKFIQENKPSCMIMNTSEAKNTIRQDDLDWIDTYFFPRAVHYGTKNLIVITPTSSITKDAMENYIYVAEKAGLFIKVAKDIEEARELASLI